MSLSIEDIKQISKELDEIKADFEPLLKLPDEAKEFIRTSLNDVDTDISLKTKELKKRYDYYLEKFEANKKANPDKAGKYIENNKNFEEIEKKYGAENEEYKTLNTKIYNAKIQKKFHPTKTYIAEKLGYKITDEENNKYNSFSELIKKIEDINIMKNGVYINDPDKPSLKALDYLYSKEYEEVRKKEEESEEESEEEKKTPEGGKKKKTKKNKKSKGGDESLGSLDDKQLEAMRYSGDPLLQEKAKTTEKLNNSFAELEKKMKREILPHGGKKKRKTKRKSKKASKKTRSRR